MAQDASRDLIALSATALAALIRAKRVSPVEVLDAHLARLDRFNPKLNAVIADRRDEARREAQAATARLTERDVDLPPFHGVPCTIKEAIEVSGLPHTVGMTRRREVVGKRDAPVVERMRRAGFIPIGVTNVPEGCFWFETGNLVHGRTVNPYDARRGAGGSSGGEGAALGAGLAPVGLGSDIGGSIRIPAFFCGVFGLKPSQGRVPFTGHWPFHAASPVAQRDQFHMVTIGPMGRKAEDLIPVLRAIEGADGVDEHTRRTGPLPLGDPRAVSWQGRKVFVLAAPYMKRVGRVTAELSQATETAARHLERLGATIVTVDERIFEWGFRIWAATIASLDLPKMEELVAAGKPSTALKELLGLVTGRSTHSFPVLQACLGERLLPLIPGKDAAKLQGVGLRVRLAEMLGQDHVLIMPPHPRTAPRHNASLLRPFDLAVTGIWNVLGFPVAAIPMGLGAGGMPLGVQVAAGFGADHLTAAAALALEEAFGGWVMPVDSDGR